MAAEIGNKYWKFRNKHGRDFKYTPELLDKELDKYMEWLEENPLYEEKVFAYQGQITTHNSPKMRAATIMGFCLFAGICEKTFANYRDNKDFIQVITRIETVIKVQKFEGAAAELLNPNIIARDLALGENIDIKTAGEKLNTTTTVEFINARKESEKKK